MVDSAVAFFVICVCQPRRQPNCQTYWLTDRRTGRHTQSLWLTVYYYYIFFVFWKRCNKTHNARGEDNHTWIVCMVGQFEWNVCSLNCEMVKFNEFLCEMPEFWNVRRPFTLSPDIVAAGSSYGWTSVGISTARLSGSRANFKTLISTYVFANWHT